MIISTTDYTNESLHSNSFDPSDIGYLHLEVKSITQSEIKKFIEAIKENIFSYLENDEYIAFNSDNFFSKVREVDIELYDYIADFNDSDDFFFIDYFDYNPESIYDEENDEYIDDEDDEYAGIEDYDSMSALSNDPLESYFVKFIKRDKVDNNLFIEVSNNINTRVSMSSKLFLSLFA